MKSILVAQRNMRYGVPSGCFVNESKEEFLIQMTDQPPKLTNRPSHSCAIYKTKSTLVV